MSQVMKEEMPTLPLESQEAAKNRADAVLKEARSILQGSLLTVIDKIERRRNVSDGDLCGSNPLGMFVLAWERCDRDSVMDCLTDVGMTCVQGDTHRLFSLILAHHRDFALSSPKF